MGGSSGARVQAQTALLAWSDLAGFRVPLLLSLHKARLLERADCSPLLPPGGHRDNAGPARAWGSLGLGSFWGAWQRRRLPCLIELSHRRGVLLTATL